MAPHNPNGPIATLAAAHLMSAIPNALILETVGLGRRLRDVRRDRGPPAPHRARRPAPGRPAGPRRALACSTTCRRDVRRATTRRPGEAARRPTPITWFADLESLVPRLEILEVLDGEIGLTTVGPESHLSHTSGFAVSAPSSRPSPLADWRDRPGLRDHRDCLRSGRARDGGPAGHRGRRGRRAPPSRHRRNAGGSGLRSGAMPDSGHTAAEVFPEFAPSISAGALCPDASRGGPCSARARPSSTTGWRASLADVAGRYDLDGWFLDHARNTRRPGMGRRCSRVVAPSARPRLPSVASTSIPSGTSSAAVRPISASATAVGLPRRARPCRPRGPCGLARRPARRAGLVRRPRPHPRGAIRGRSGRAVTSASPRCVESGATSSRRVSRSSAAMSTTSGRPPAQPTSPAGFAPNIGWGCVGRDHGDVARTVARVRGSGHVGRGFRPVRSSPPWSVPVNRRPNSAPTVTSRAISRRTSPSWARMAAVRAELPVYPPVAGPPEPEASLSGCAAGSSTRGWTGRCWRASRPRRTSISG